MSPIATIVVTCKGRLPHLRRTLPTMLAQRCPIEYEIVVVDYACPQGTFDWCRGLNLRALRAVSVLDAPRHFNLAHARNCGAAHALGSILAFVDADARLHETWLAAVTRPILAGRAGLCRAANLRGGWERAGTCAVSAEVYRAARGYDEGLAGWGPEDEDFYQRAGRLAPTARYAPGLVLPLRHGDNLRTAHYAERSILASAQVSYAHLNRRAGVVNPAGFGRGVFDLFRGVELVAPSSPSISISPFSQPIRYTKRVRSSVRIRS